MSRIIAVLLSLVLAAACGDEAPTADPAVSPPPGAPDDTVPVQEVPADPDEPVEEELVNPSTGELLPMPFAALWAPARMDYPAMIERRAIRVLVPYGGYQFYYDRGRPRGAVYGLVRRFETFLNNKLKSGNLKVYVIVIPVSRDELLPALRDGHGDFVAGDLTITSERSAEFSFSRPLLTDINEVVVTGPSAPRIETLSDLAGQEIVVRASSSYFEHLQSLAAEFESQGLEPPVIRKADELLEAEDLLEMVDGGIFGVTVLDEYKARFWSEVFEDIVVRDDLVVNQGGSIAWVTRQDTPLLLDKINRFLRQYGKGTLVGNDTFNRYLADASRVRCAHTARNSATTERLAALFRQYGDQYDFDWLMLAAQGYQESGLRQDRRSPAGAVGVMQIKPSTAADRNVGIDDVSNVENNIHAGSKYMRFLADRYFAGEGISELNQWLLTLAAYNAGPARVARLRREAADLGYDRNIWFNNVEIIAARRIGRETVTYVSNIFKYYVGYQVIRERGDVRSERHGETLQGCL